MKKRLIHITGKTRTGLRVINKLVLQKKKKLDLAWLRHEANGVVL